MNSNFWRDPVVIPLDSAINLRSLDMAGHYVQIIETSDPTAKIRVRINEADSREYTLYDGMGWRHGPFDTLYISADAQPGQSVTLLIGGDPSEAKPELLQWFPRSRVSAVEVSNWPVPGTDTPLPADVREWNAGPLSVEADRLTLSAGNQIRSGWASATDASGANLVTYNDGETLEAGGNGSIIHAAWVTGADNVAVRPLLRVLDGSYATMANVQGVYGTTRVLQNVVIPSGWRFAVSNRGAAGVATAAVIIANL